MLNAKADSLELLHDGPEAARARIVLAHGAGAGMRSPFMQRMAAGLAARGLHVTRFEFGYMRAREHGERRPPDRAPVLMQTWRDVLEAIGGAERAVIGGKSMGGRIASMIADEVRARGLVCLGYPFHPPKKPEQLRTAHLEKLATQALFVQGSRDEFGTRGEIAGYTLSPRIELRFVEDGDHSLTVRKKLGHDPKATFEGVVDAVAAFCERACR